MSHKLSVLIVVIVVIAMIGVAFTWAIANLGVGAPGTLSQDASTKAMLGKNDPAVVQLTLFAVSIVLSFAGVIVLGVIAVGLLVIGLPFARASRRRRREHSVLQTYHRAAEAGRRQSQLLVVATEERREEPMSSVA